MSRLLPQAVSPEEEQYPRATNCLLKLTKGKGGKEGNLRRDSSLNNLRCPVLGETKFVGGSHVTSPHTKALYKKPESKANACSSFHSAKRETQGQGPVCC